MAVDPKYIEAQLKTAFPGGEVSVIDLVGDGDHLQATIISEKFEGKRLLQQHQMVYGALGDILKDQLHALALKTYTPEQWKTAGSR